MTWLCLTPLLLLLPPPTSTFLPPSFDIADILSLSEVSNMRLVGVDVCYVTGPFVLTTALEISHHLYTGQHRTFSVQEFVDCHNNGCYETDIRDYVEWLVVNDRLAPAPQYSNYRAEVYTCRAGTAPDGLGKVRVTGIREIEVEKFEQELLAYGSVIACIDTSTHYCPLYRDYREGIIDGYPSRNCHERVLVVGYTPDYYRVRTSNGAEWGENGYFRILRGGNRCGIEAAMYVLETIPRDTKPGISPLTGCPVQYPLYCDVTKTCRGSQQECVKAVLSEEEENRREEDIARKRPNSYNYPSRRRRRGVVECGDAPGYPCHAARRRRRGVVECGDAPGYPCHAARRRRRGVVECGDAPGYPCHAPALHCGHRQVRVHCGATCGMCGEDGTPRCQDKGDYPEECEVFSSYCSLVPAVRVKCPWTCRVDPRDCRPRVLDMIRQVVRYAAPPTGPCYLPLIPGGRVLATTPTIPHNTLLAVQCDPGLVLVGEPVYCEIQNVYRPDTRRLPQCMEIGPDRLTGNGRHYTGGRFFGSEGHLCDNWLSSAHTGTFVGVTRGLDLLQGGNHNYCRNIGGEDYSPYCYIQGGQLKVYCYELPGCGGEKGLCSDPPRSNRYQGDCHELSSTGCRLPNEHYFNRAMWYWENCNAMCCSQANCQ